MKTSKYKAYWHAWHQPYLFFFLTAEEYSNRVEAIKTTKPKHEIPTRLQLFQPVRGEIPVVLEQALMNVMEAQEKEEESFAKWKKAKTEQEKKDTKWWDERVKMWEESGARLVEIYKKCLPYLEKLHAEECGCKEWDGGKLVFPKEGG